MDQRSNLGGTGSYDPADDNTGVLGSDTAYRGMTVAQDYDGDTLPGQYGNDGTSGDDNDSDIQAQRQRIEQTRAQMGSTIDAIEERLSPSRLAQEAKSAVKDATVGSAQQAVSNITDSASNAGGSFVDAIRENPVPAALAGIGLGWLIMSMRNKNDQQMQRDAQRYRYYGHNMYPTQHASGNAQSNQGSVIGSAQSAAGQVAGTVQDTAGQMAGTIQDTASQVTDTIGSAAGTAADTMGQMTNQAQYGFQQAENQLQRWMREQPLAVTAGAFAVGMAVGFAVPETPVEDQWMGQYREDLTQQAQQAVQQTAPKVGAVAQQTVDAAKNAAENAASEQGLTASSSKSSSKSSSSKNSKSSGNSGSSSS